ncbi:RagB/SusD family nutrient uptake outer membrane protein [Bacteroides sp.]|uniref:RagB/SusD family nutrient uptake outer membrane protein n=1 Tax=Bacteroides sp. TaxID=29523 RepID=UPI0023C37FCB|nr:RagB/SusD family nutrient uptake outer membrane protein [Bacteroides sp.]MDE6216514.1 RagB/SusD family nutrient uptake outer membrane protein [Bacteroides sp.]
MKRIFTYMVAGMSLFATSSCSDFLDTAPYDALSPATTWKTEDDAAKFLIGCYDGWIDYGGILYWDCGSDFGYNNFPWEGYNKVGNGLMAAADPGVDMYSFGKIRSCNDFLANIENVTFADDAKKKDMVAQVKVIRAYQYFQMNWNYGGVPIIESWNSSEEAMVSRSTEEEVNNFIEKELDEAIPMFLNDKTDTRGSIDRATALALKMRHALYYGEYERAKKAASDIMAMDKYSLDPDFLHMFSLAGKDSEEIIMSDQRIENLYENWLLQVLYNNADGGWSSIVPTKQLVDAFEMDNGLTKEEAGDYYDPAHPFAHRDPRMAMTVVFPGMDWVKLDGSVEVLNTLEHYLEDTNGDGKLGEGDDENPNHPLTAGNASQTGLTWGKYTIPMTQYGSDLYNSSMCVILFRYAEVLLSYAEAENELNGPSRDVYTQLNLVRNRVGMPNVDEEKYNTKEKLRELIRRERSIELAGEGFRRADILRWKDSEGKMLAETVLNGDLVRFTGIVNYDEEDPYMRAVISDETELIESRQFRTYNRYLPIPQKALDLNKNLEQNDGY